MALAEVIDLQERRSNFLDLRRLAYLGPDAPARCSCGAGRSEWALRKGLRMPTVMDEGDHLVVKYRCRRCGCPILKAESKAVLPTRR